MTGPGRGAGVVLVALLGAGCSDAPEPACEARDGEAAVACAEAAFWPAYQHLDETGRRAGYAQLTAVIDAHGDAASIGRLYFLRGTLGMALVLENQLGAEFLDAITPDLDRAVALVPEDPRYPPWPETMRMTLTYVRGDTAGFEAATRAALASVARYPTGNILTISGTMAGFPLATGLPAQAVELLGQWRCDQEWCQQNTAKAPFSQPGLQYQFADLHARIGNRAETASYLERALAADGADRWAFRAEAAARLADLDGYLGRFAALGDDEPALFEVLGNRSCLLCHAAASP